MVHHIGPATPKTTPRGFEPLRAEPNGFLVHLLNHSDTVSLQITTFEIPKNCWYKITFLGILAMRFVLGFRMSCTVCPRAARRPHHRVLESDCARILCAQTPESAGIRVRREPRPCELFSRAGADHAAQHIRAGSRCFWPLWRRELIRAHCMAAAEEFSSRCGFLHGGSWEEA